MLLWPLDEVARQLGGVSTRTVRRLIDKGELPSCRIGRLVRVPSDSVGEYVTRIAGVSHAKQFGENSNSQPSGVTLEQEAEHNPPCAESVAWKESKPCHIDAKTRRFGGSNTPTQAANRLTDLLEQMTGKRRKPLKQNGG